MGGFFGCCSRGSSGGGLPATPTADSVLVNGPGFGNVPAWLTLAAFLTRASPIQLEGTSQDVLASGSHNNVAPGGGINSTNIWQLQSTTGDVTLTGIQAPTGVTPFGPDGWMLLIENVGAANNLIFSINDAGSLAANRIAGIGATYTLAPGGCIWLNYDGVNHTWRIVP